ncbi:unnamed protein product, partial [Rotaria sp. Silwood1]
KWIPECKHVYPGTPIILANKFDRY